MAISIKIYLQKQASDCIWLSDHSLPTFAIESYTYRYIHSYKYIHVNNIWIYTSYKTDLQQFWGRKKIKITFLQDWIKQNPFQTILDSFLSYFTSDSKHTSWEKIRGSFLSFFSASVFWHYWQVFCFQKAAAQIILFIFIFIEQVSS